MISKQIVFLMAGLAFSLGCRQPRPALVPEISQPLMQEEVCSWTGSLAGEDIFPCAGGIGWLDAAGRIIAWDADKKSVAPVLELPFRVEAPSFRQGRFLVLKKGRADRRLLVIDLEKPAVLADLEGLKADVVLGVDNDHLVYLEGGRLAVNSWRQANSVFHAAATEDKFFNCHFSAERILIMSQGFLHTFWKKSGTFAATPLPQPAISPFFCQGEHIYYGSSERFLVKYSSAKNRLAWKVKLGQALERAPLVFAGSIVASPADHSVLLVNQRGSILWWQALLSTMSFDLLPMSDNLVAVLLNRKIKFIDPRRRQVTVFPGIEPPLGPPLAFRGDLYYLARAGETCRLLRVGNRYGIEIELDPAQACWVGRSLRFVVQPHHLLDPRWECEILDAQGRSVFNKSMQGAEKVSLVWVPLRPGKYLIRVQAKALNRDALGEAPIQVLDPQQVFPNFYLHF